MANLQKYADFSVEEAEQATEELDKMGSGADFLKFERGKNQVRFLPAKIGEKVFVLIQQHFIEIPGSTSPVVFACPRIHAKRHCPACEQADKLRDSGNPSDYDRAGKLLPRLRVFCNVVDRKNPEGGVKIAAFGKQIYEQLLALRKNEEAGGNFTDPGPNGFDIIIEKSGEGLKTEYKVWPARKTSELGNDEWLDTMRDLKRYARVPSPEELAKILGGQRGGGASGGGGGGSAPAQTRATKRSAADDAIDTDGEPTE
jgi:hypothetical protein